jgi:HSP20 family protein
MSKTLSTRRRPAPLSRSPFRSPFGGLFARRWMDDMFDQFLGENVDNQLAAIINAAMDVSETDQAFEVKMDLPGVSPDNVDIQIDNNTLTVRGQRSEESEEKDEKRQFHRVERSFGSFARSIVLPTSINEDETAAQFKDGVLKIVIPKTEDSKPRKISIKK